MNSLLAMSMSPFKSISLWCGLIGICSYEPAQDYSFWKKWNWELPGTCSSNTFNILPGKCALVYTLLAASVQFSCSVISDSLQPHELQHAWPPCPLPTPGVYPNPCPLCR